MLLAPVYVQNESVLDNQLVILSTKNSISSAFHEFALWFFYIFFIFDNSPQRLHGKINVEAWAGEAIMSFETMPMENASFVFLLGLSFDNNLMLIDARAPKTFCAIDFSS